MKSGCIICTGGELCMKQPNRRMLRLFAVMLLLLAAGFLLRQRLQRAPQDAVILSDAQAREAWLNLRGWVVAEPAVSETYLPCEWVTPAGQRWLQLQHGQGLSPEQYAGSAAKRYVYPVENGGKTHLYAELLLCGDALAGAQVYDAQTQVMRSVR